VGGTNSPVHLFEVSYIKICRGEYLSLESLYEVDGLCI
jgi:hypothetical protein